jgi:hypothetical protein
MKNYQNPLTLGYYPFPETSIPEHVERLKADAENWLDNDYTFLTDSERRLYKIANLAYTTIRMLPHANTSYERMKPAVRWMVVVTVSDDYYELSTRDEIKDAAERVRAILLGADPLPGEMVFFHQYAIMRDELRAFMPDEWMERMAKDMYEYLLFGIREMAAYTATGSLPNTAIYSIIREFDVAVIPFMNFVECEIDFILPKYVVDHPVIQRIRSLMGKIIGFQNDFYSLEKEAVRGASKTPCDLIRVMEKEYELSFEEACREALRLHDDCVTEFASLQSALPDFGSLNKDIENYSLYMGIGIQGLNTWYHLDTLRYKPEGYQDIEKRDTLISKNSL